MELLSFQLWLFNDYFSCSWFQNIHDPGGSFLAFLQRRAGCWPCREGSWSRQRVGGWSPKPVCSLLVLSLFSPTAPLMVSIIWPNSSSSEPLLFSTVFWLLCSCQGIFRICFWKKCFIMLANWNIIPTNLHVLGKASGAGWVGGLAQAAESQGQDSYTASQAQTPPSLLWVRRPSHFVAKYALSLHFLFLKDLFLSGELAMLATAFQAMLNNKQLPIWIWKNSLRWFVINISHRAYC